MKIRTILGMLLLITLLAGSIGGAAAVDCEEINCKGCCEDGDRDGDCCPKECVPIEHLHLEPGPHKGE